MHFPAQTWHTQLHVFRALALGIVSRLFALRLMPRHIAQVGSKDLLSTADQLQRLHFSDPGRFRGSEIKVSDFLKFLKKFQKFFKPLNSQANRLHAVDCHCQFSSS